MTRDMSVEVLPITADDVDAVGCFLHEAWPRVSPSRWAAVIGRSWQADAPNHGFMLREGAAVVGAYLAYYSERCRDGRVEAFCNLSTWYVAESHRTYGMLLLRALLAQKGYHFTDLIPNRNVAALNKRFGFVELDTTKVLVPNLPWPLKARRSRLLSTSSDIESVLTGEALSVFRDHRDSAAARHLVIVEDDGRTCYVMFRFIDYKRLPVFAALLYVSDREVFARRQGSVYRHLLLRTGRAATVVETRLVAAPPRSGRPLRLRGTRMFRSDRLKDADIDYLYSELTEVPW